MTTEASVYHHVPPSWCSLARYSYCARLLRRLCLLSLQTVKRGSRSVSHGLSRVSGRRYAQTWLYLAVGTYPITMFSQPAPPPPPPRFQARISAGVDWSGGGGSFPATARHVRGLSLCGLSFDHGRVGGGGPGGSSSFCCRETRRRQAHRQRRFASQKRAFI